MPEVFTLTCPTCGGKLQIAPDLDRFACAHCGNEHIVVKGTGTISILPIREDLHKIGTGVDRTASELALTRIEAEVRAVKSELSDLKSKYGAYSLFMVVGVLGIGCSVLVPLLDFSAGNVLIALLLIVILGIPPILISRRTTARLKPQIDILTEKLKDLSEEYLHHRSIVGK